MRKVIVPLMSGNISRYGKMKVDFVPISYTKKLLKYNLIPIFISPMHTKKNIDILYEECGGVFLMGGGDFDPKTYGEKKRSHTIISEPDRDSVEIYVTKKALADEKPIIGICRGCQALSIASGGVLEQHIPNIVKREKHNLDKGSVYTDMKKNKHQIKIDSKSKAYKIIGKKKIIVNSAHHQSIKNPGLNMIISGVSLEGIAEIIENANSKFFCFGLQSHPEIDNSGSLEPFFKKFAEEVKLFKNKKF